MICRRPSTTPVSFSKACRLSRLFALATVFDSFLRSALLR